MQELEPGLQIVLQRPDGGALCEGFGGVPAVHPCYITIGSDGTPDGHRNAVALGRELRRQILLMPGATASSAMPCGGRGGPYICFATGRSYCRKVAVTVCDGTMPVNPPDFARYGGTNLVCFPTGTDAKTVLPPWLKTTHAATWSSTVTEVVPAVFGAVQLTPGTARLFISYRQREAGELSEQLFEELGKIGFDVFVDRFRGTPGSDFQRRILEEIAHKSMVLFLETQTTATAEWTRYEIAVAKSLRVGLLALLVPGGTPIPGIDNGRRMLIRTADLEPGTQTLNATKMAEVLERIKTDHTLNEMRRRQLLRDSMRRALAYAKVHDQQLVEGNMIEVTPKRRSSKKYLIALPTRPAELADFYDTASAISGARHVRTIVAPASHVRDVRRQHMLWLSRISDVQHFDESSMLNVARRMEAEAL